MAKRIKETRVASFAELHEALAKYKKSRWIFRGHSDARWKLLPKIGRSPFAGTEEKAIFAGWKRRAIEFIDLAPVDDWDWLAIAQHHGLATRLLDWSFNPLVAAFFAVYQPSEGDAHIWAFYPKWHLRRESVLPLEYEGVRMFKPSAVARRISRQGGLFTVHGPPTISLDKALEMGQKLEKIIIDEGYRSELLYELDHYGVNKVSLFPDLDGLSEYVNWFMVNREQWKAPESEEDDAFALDFEAG